MSNKSGFHLPQYGIFKIGREVYVGRFSRNYAGDYINGVRIALSASAGLFREMKELGIKGIDPSDVISSCEEGGFSFPKYTLNGNCHQLSERDYRVLRSRLLSASLGS